MMQEIMETCQAATATPEELAEADRKCWHPDCYRTAKLDSCGWRWCWRHYWPMEVRDAETFANRWVTIKYTQIIWKNLFK